MVMILGENLAPGAEKLRRAGRSFPFCAYST